MIFISKDRLDKYIETQVRIALKDSIKDMAIEDTEKAEGAYSGGHIYRIVPVDQYIRETVNSMQRDGIYEMKQKVYAEIENESFIDSVVERISKKQLK